MKRTALLNWNFYREEPGAVPENVRLPHAAFTEPDNITDQWQGRCIYFTSFDVPADIAGKSIYLEITGAMQRCSVYLNDQYLFTHCGGYDRFVTRLDTLKPGERNLLRLELDNRATDDCPPGKPLAGLDFCYYSGLYREAALVEYPALHISDPLAVAKPADGGVFFRTLKANAETADVEISCHVVHEVPVAERFELPAHYEESYPCQVHFTLRDAAGNIAAERTGDVFPLQMNCDHTFREKFSTPQPALWSPAHPALYTLSCELLLNGEVVDCHTEKVGIRQLTVSAKDGLRFSGETLFFVASNRHQDYPHVGNAVPPNAQKRDAVMLKKGNRNFLRLAHYPQHQAFLDACDELGIAVIACIPGWQYYALNDAFLTTLWRDVRELIRDYRNHPCIAFWEVSLNETYPPNWINTELNRLAHEEYPGCITCGDTYGLFDGWDVLYSRKNLKTDKPILVREYGDWCFGMNESTSRQTRGGGEKAMLQQVWNYLWTGNLLGKDAGVIGVEDWCAWDYNRGYYPVTHHGGDGDIFRVPRYKYHFYRTQGAAEPMVFAAAEWNREPGSSGKVVIFSNCEEIELRVNGKVVARRRPDDGPDTDYNVNALEPLETAAAKHPDSSGGNPFDGGNASFWPHPPFTFNDVPFEAGELTAVGFNGGKEAARDSVCTGGPAAKMELILREDGVPVTANDLVFAEVHLLDAAGHPAHGEDMEVTLTAENAKITGPAVKRTEAGIVSFLLRFLNAGKVCISASGKDLPDTAIEITVPAE